MIAEAQKRGISVVVSAQSVGQLRQALGPDGVSTLYDVCGNHMVLKLNDEMSAKHYSDMIGTREYTREVSSSSSGLNVGMSMGGPGIGFSPGKSAHKEKRQDNAVLASEIQGQTDLTCYAKIGSFPWFVYDFRPRVSTVKFYNSKTTEFIQAEHQSTTHTFVHVNDDTALDDIAQTKDIEQSDIEHER